MEVRTFFLGEHRTVPTNYKHVLVNPLRIDWANFANNYKEVITMAVDHADAEGRAFVTEYAGTSDVVAPPYVDDDAAGEGFASHENPTTLTLGLLQSWALMSCDDWYGCSFRSELLKPIMDQFIPVPESIEPYEYYGCPECYAGIADLEAWDGAAFGEMIEDRLLEPARHAKDIMANHAYLTRLYTTISPYEMTQDPIFEENQDLEDVSNQLMAVAEVDCNNNTIWTLPGGMQVYSPDLSFPQFPDEDPWAMTVETGTTIGANQVVADMCPAIISSLGAHNTAMGFSGSYGQCGPGDNDGETGDGSSQNDGPGSCACTADGQGNNWGGLAFMVLMGGLLRRRNRS